MRIEKKTVQIGKSKTSYEIFPMDTTPALKILTRLTKTILPSIGALIDGAGSKPAADGELPKEQVDLNMAMRELAERLDESQVLDTIKELLAPEHVRLGTGMEMDFEKQFGGGNLKEMFDLVKAVLEVNYGDFFGVIGEAVNRFQKGSKAMKPGK